jgi:hypothetical protein
MELSIDQLLEGKATVIKDKEYFSAKDYITPFLERMSKFTNEFRAQAKLPNQMSLNSTSTDVIYNRVNVEAILPDEYEFEGHKRVVGFVYALDTRKPIVKQYVGAIRSACLNLCVFNPEALSVQELNPETAIDYSFLNNCLSITDTINSTLKKLSKKIYTKEECYESIGEWVDKCINTKYMSVGGSVKLAETMPVDVYKNLFYNKKSDYYTENGVVNGFDIYNSFTDIICNGTRSDLVNRFEKTYLVSKVLDI